MNTEEKEFAREVYKRTFEAITGLPGWYIGLDRDMWIFSSGPVAPLTRDEAFKNVAKRRRKL